MKKVYISIPITGRSLDIVVKQAEIVKACLHAAGYDPVTPFDICPEQGKPYAYYMARDIEVLLECYAIYMCPGWRESKGCRAEAAIAEIYGIPMLNLKSLRTPFFLEDSTSFTKGKEQFRGVGETFDYNGYCLRVVEGQLCDGCVFDGWSNRCSNKAVLNITGCCSRIHRKDGKSVIFRHEPDMEVKWFNNTKTT